MSSDEKKQRALILGKSLIFFVSLFCFTLFILGDSFGQMNNSNCFKLMGCNAGFFGYDAFVHLISGMMQATFILWLARRYTRFNILHNSFWKSFFVIVATVALIGLCWEMLEFLGDRFRIFILHINLFTPNKLFQASNADTMGDMIFALIGAKVILLSYRLARMDSLVVKTNDEKK